MKYTTIESQGQKWLRPINVPYPNEDDQEEEGIFQLADAVLYKQMTADLLYIGSKPAGSTLDESEVREVRQGLCEYTMKWITEYDDDLPTYNRYRTAYTDAEYDRDIDYEKEMPHNQWPSTAYVAKKEDSQHGSNDYWKRRALAAEKYIAKSPCDPDIYEEQMVAYRQWQSIVKEELK